MRKYIFRVQFIFMIAKRNSIITIEKILWIFSVQFTFMFAERNSITTIEKILSIFSNLLHTTNCESVLWTQSRHFNVDSIQVFYFSRQRNYVWSPYISIKQSYLPSFFLWTTLKALEYQVFKVKHNNE